MLVPERPRLFVLYGLVFLYTAAMGLAMPLVPQFLRVEFGAGPLVIGLVAAVYGALQVFARVPLGAWADRAGRRTAVLVAFLSTIAGGAFFVAAPSVAWIIPGQVLFALSSSAFWVAANAYVVDVLPPERVPRAMTHYSVAMGLGFLVGPPLGGLADVFGFRAALAAFPVIGLLGAVLSFALLDTGRSARRVPMGQAYREAAGLLREPVLLFSTAGTFTFAILIGSMSTFLPVHLRALSYTAAAIGVVFTLREGAALAFRLGFARFLTNERAAVSMLAGILLAAVATAALPLADTIVGIAVLSVVAGVGIGAIIPANLTLIASAAPPDRRSLAMGLYGTALGVGTSVSPPALGWLAERYGLAWAFVGAGVVGAGLVVVLAVRLRSVVFGRATGTPPLEEAI
ncbi:MAG TPA: MFS transporter [Candidatus Thermoplasmatota archaeon]|nr:MFS transporter [Candidatus Thermoplasmatota archaeon]